MEVDGPPVFTETTLSESISRAIAVLLAAVPRMAVCYTAAQRHQSRPQESVPPVEGTWAHLHNVETGFSF